MKIIFLKEKKSFKTNILNLRIKYVFSPINSNFLGLVLKQNYSIFVLFFKILQIKKVFLVLDIIYITKKLRTKI